MTYTDWHRERSCEGKSRFGEEATARATARDSAVRHQEPYHAWTVYTCIHCGWLHVGHARGWTAVSRAERANVIEEGS